MSSIFYGQWQIDHNIDIELAEKNLLAYIGRVGNLANIKFKEMEIQEKQPVPPPTVGRIVHFYPGYGDGSYKLPNGMDFAPAIVSQVCSEEHINLTVFVMARPDQGLPYPSINAWSICNLELLNSENFLPDSHPAYWVYPPRV